MPAAQSKLPQMNCPGPCTWCSALQSCTNGKTHQRDQVQLPKCGQSALPNGDFTGAQLSCRNVFKLLVDLLARVMSQHVRHAPATASEHHCSCQTMLPGAKQARRIKAKTQSSNRLGHRTPHVASLAKTKSSPMAAAPLPAHHDTLRSEIPPCTISRPTSPSNQGQVKVARNTRIDARDTEKRPKRLNVV